jgi:hypothetical protein
MARPTERTPPFARRVRSPVQPVQEDAVLGVRYNDVGKRFVFAVAVGLALIAAVLADDNVHALPRFPISVPGLPPRRVPIQP